MIEATEETPCHEWCNQLRDTIDALTAERHRYREAMEEVRRLLPTRGIGHSTPARKAIDATLEAALNPPKEPT